MSVVYRIMLEDYEHNQWPHSMGSVAANRAMQAQRPLPPSPFQVKSYHIFLTRYIWIVPLLCAVLFPFLCISMYIVALNYGHIEAFFPYISDTGALAPEAGWFDQLMDLAAIFVILTGTIRYKQCKFYIDSIGHSNHAELKQLYKLYHINLYSMLCLYPCSLGLMLIGNFRTSELPALHMIGNILVLGIVLSCVFQIYLCRQLWSVFGVESAPTTMTIMLVVGLIFTVLTFIFTYTSFFIAGLDNAFNFKFGLHWTRDKKGYVWHVLATLTEWAGVAVSIPFYFVCLFSRMRNFHRWDAVWK